MVYERECPGCQMIIKYSEKYLYNRAVRENRHCKSCGSKKAQDWKRINSFERLCPKCNKKLIYKSYHAWWYSKTNNLLCRSCVKLGKKMPGGFSEKISKIVSGSGNPMHGNNHTIQTKTTISIKNRGNKSKTGQICDENTKMNMRNSAIARIKIQGTSRSYNPAACDYMDINMKPLYDFIHAKNNKSEFMFRGYFADGYDKTKNVWFEYDEPHHYKLDGSLKNRDLYRMMEILKHLGGRFLRYDERNKVLREYYLTSDGYDVIVTS